MEQVIFISFQSFCVCFQRIVLYLCTTIDYYDDFISVCVCVFVNVNVRFYLFWY